MTCLKRFRRVLEKVTPNAAKMKILCFLSFIKTPNACGMPFNSYLCIRNIYKCIKNI